MTYDIILEFTNGTVRIEVCSDSIKGEFKVVDFNYWCDVLGPLRSMTFTNRNQVVFHE